MKKILSVVLMGLLLSGCSLFRTHKVDIDQGNILSQENVSRLHKGMSEDQVKDIMGTPILVNLFSDTRVDYIYTLQPGHGEMTEKRVTCIFQGGRLREVTSSLPPVTPEKVDSNEDRRERITVSSAFNSGLSKIQESLNKVKSRIWV